VVAGRPVAHKDDLAEGYRLAVATSELSGLDSLPLPESLQEAVEHGEVFTRRWVVEAVPPFLFRRRTGTITG
jgi:hypothetical protein